MVDSDELETRAMTGHDFKFRPQRTRMAFKKVCRRNQHEVAGATPSQSLRRLSMPIMIAEPPLVGPHRQRAPPGASAALAWPRPPLSPGLSGGVHQIPAKRYLRQLQ